MENLIEEQTRVSKTLKFENDHMKIQIKKMEKGTTELAQLKDLLNIRPGNE